MQAQSLAFHTLTLNTAENKAERKDNSGLLILFSYLRVNKVSLVVVETSLAEVTVGQRVLQEVSAIQLMPRVLDLTR